MMKVFRLALVAATIAFSAEMARADDFQDGLTAAQAGDATAQRHLGWMYLDGTGVIKDGAEAVRWFRLAADQGDAAGQFALGLMYEDGIGVPRDLVTAHMWQNIADTNGVEFVANPLDSLEQQMTPEDILEATRRARLCMASSYADCD